MNTHGKVFKYPDNVDTDVIIPARYLNTSDAAELAAHCMEDIDTDFVINVKNGDVMVAGWNFGWCLFTVLQGGVIHIESTCAV